MSEDETAEFEHGVDMSPAQIEVAMVKSCIEFNVDSVNDSDWKWNCSLCEDLNVTCYDFIFWWWSRFTVAYLRCPFERNFTGDP